MTLAHALSQDLAAIVETHNESGADITLGAVPALNAAAATRRLISVDNATGTPSPPTPTHPPP